MFGTQFNTATSILFVGYLLMQLPSNLLLTRVRPSIYLGLAMCLWGVISASQAATHSFPALVVARFFLGFSEAPFFPGAVFLMSSWYKRSELTQRMAWFFAGSSLANAFGGLIGAAVLGNLEGAHGIAGWRWLFIIEGVITIGLALIATVILPDYPSTTRWLTAEEKAYAAWRLREDTGEEDEADAISIKEGVLLALRDPRLYLFTLFQHCSLLSQSFQYFFPTIVKTLNYGSVQTLLRKIDNDTLCRALKGANERTRAFFLAQMSTRAAKNLTDEMQALGPVRLKEVDEAQAKMTETAKDLAEKGEIMIAKNSAEEELVY